MIGVVGVIEQRKVELSPEIIAYGFCPESALAAFGGTWTAPPKLIELIVASNICEAAPVATFRSQVTGH